MTSQLLCSVTNFSSGHIVITAQNTAGESEDSVPVVGKVILENKNQTSDQW